MSSKLPRNHSHVAVFHRHCVGDLHASVRVSEWRALLSFVGLASSFESFDARHGVLVERKCFLPFCATVWCSLI